MRRYNPKEIEPKWQQKWDQDGTYVVDFHSKKPKYVAFGMFNYPSGAGIHVGHVRNFTIPDVITRVKRQQGFESYQPVGWDSFGLPAENYAIKTGVAPQQSTVEAIEKYHEQYRAMGWAMDWTKEINTTDPEYYKWTQWCFLKLFENDLAYQKESPQWWCDQCKTVLADEQVIAGKCWRHDGPDDPEVTKKNLKQWFFKITDYADEMLEDTDALDWTQSVKSSQKSWIGKSVGAEIDFKIADSEEVIKVFTTRPDTIYGATFMVLAPEHPLVNKITTESQKSKIKEYQKATSLKTEVQRQQDADKEKTGVFTGAYAINPANDKKIPIWIADYVLMGYGTGAIMAVPAHDERDHDFAKKFDIPVIQVIMPCEDDPNNPPQPGFEEVVRDTVIVHLRDKSTGKYALLDWHGTLEGITTAIMGGIEDGQSAEDAARIEIEEEAGLKNIKITKKLEWLTAATYCASHKKQNRKAIAQVLLAEIDSISGQKDVSNYEKQTHTLVWVDEKDVLERLIPVHQKFVWQQLQEEKILSDEGELINSEKYDGSSSSQAREKIVADLAAKGVAKEKVNYKMRDWLISRQRYWGAPIPIIHCPRDGAVAVPEEDLPVELPLIDNYQPTGGNASVLAGVEDWVNTKCPKCGGEGKRETDTMDGYVCSSWYFLRYMDPTNGEKAWDEKQASKWMPVDCYNGGDHATAHLLYARFFNRFFHKLGLIESKEPFKKMIFHGKIKAHDGSNFSKSKGNGIDPLQVIEQGYGADAIRLYQMFAAPLELDVLWDEQGIPGAYRFINRVWNLVQWFSEAEDGQTNDELLTATHRAIKKISEEIEANRFNTAIAGMMEFTNVLYKTKESTGINTSASWRFALESLLMMMAPFTPHVAEEMWQELGHKETIHKDFWPQWDEARLTSETMKIVIQVNGKVRANIDVPTEADETAITEVAMQDENVKKYVDNKKPAKVIYVPGRLMNLVIKD